MVERFLTPREAAEKMGVTERTMEYLRSKGDGPPITRLGDRLIRYPETQLETWLAARTAKPGAGQ
jgi:excisionase family DNA binding protein